MNVVVLGMHRSGTSALTRCLNLMGLGVGERLLKPNEYNPRGYWESQDVVRINDEILKLHGLDWTSLDEMSVNRPLSSSLVRKTETVVHRLQRPFVVKDPRLCRTLPYWKSAFGRVAYVLISRNAESVARSLYRRDSMEYKHAVQLRQVYVAESIAYTHGEKRIQIQFENLLDSPMDTLNQLKQFLGLVGDVQQAVNSIDVKQVNF